MCVSLRVCLAVKTYVMVGRLRGADQQGAEFISNWQGLHPLDVWTHAMG
ncbi:hypothetical protein B0H98_101690 [Vreelandella songnenensis]|uniref:Uncharacterized protein n=1 Tax=Vreelandella songnenensis TaxID=1176243 RepID=A0A2T0V929_9GAMM|nr:hypothetical protein B0H98_101690 [Halomonas songnenensis]